MLLASTVKIILLTNAMCSHLHVKRKPSRSYGGREWNSGYHRQGRAGERVACGTGMGWDRSRGGSSAEQWGWLRSTADSCVCLKVPGRTQIWGKGSLSFANSDQSPDSMALSTEKSGLRRGARTLAGRQVSLAGVTSRGSPSKNPLNTKK